VNASRYFADTSAWTANFNPVEYRNAGGLIIAHKCTEGTDYVNPKHRGWSLAAGLHHIAVIHYHFARPDLGNGPITEAQHFLAWALPLAGPHDYLVLDVERATPRGWSHDPEWSREFDRYVCENSRFKTILYANRSTLERWNGWLWNDARRVWDASYSSEPDYAPPGYTCVFRQLSDGLAGPFPHTVPGVGQCDVNTMSLPMFDTVRHAMA
jgi:lysozyme